MLEIRFLIKISWIINLIILVVLLIIAIILRLKSVTTFLLINDISINHNLQPIKKFYIDSKGNKCNEDNSQMFISNGFYPGTENGCYCYLGNFKNRLCDSKKNKGEFFCTDVYWTNSQLLNSWRGSSICIERFPKEFNYHYFWQRAVPKDEDCPLGYKKCGLLDTSSNEICVSNTDNCPVTYVDIIDKALFDKVMDNKDSIEIKNESFGSFLVEVLYSDIPESVEVNYISLSNEKFLVYSSYPLSTNLIKNYIQNKINYEVFTREDVLPNKYNMMPVEFKIFENIPCALSNELLRNSIGRYKLDSTESNYDYVYKCSEIDLKELNNLEDFKNAKILTTDYRYTKLDSESKLNYFDDNKITSVIKRLPEYPIDQLGKIEMNLFSRSYLGVSKNCIGGYTNPLTISNNSIISSLKMYLLISIILIIILILANFYFLIEPVKRVGSTIIFMIIVFADFIYLNFIDSIEYNSRILDCVDDLFSETIGEISIRNHSISTYTSIYKFFILFSLVLISIIIILNYFFLNENVEVKINETNNDNKPELIKDNELKNINEDEDLNQKLLDD